MNRGGTIDVAQRIAGHLSSTPPNLRSLKRSPDSRRNRTGINRGLARVREPLAGSRLETKTAAKAREKTPTP